MIIGFCFLLISCFIEPKKVENKNSSVNIQEPGKPIESNKNEQQLDENNHIESRYSYIKELEGKYPTDVNLFESGVVKTQLLNLLGEENYNLFIKNMGVQVPIEIIDDEYAFVRGGAPHNFGTDEACIEIDFINDKISVGILSEGKGVLYFTEKEDKSETKGELNTWLKEANENTNN